MSYPAGKPEISTTQFIRRENDKTLIIEDNGLGMDYFEAKQFLSNVGSSFYNSEQLVKHLNGKSYSPISKFGIGILSCFLISDGITIETLKEGHEACKFSVESVHEEWKYEKGNRKNIGTKITLNLNEDGMKLILSKSIRRYFICSDILIEYSDLDGVIIPLSNEWNADIIRERFTRNIDPSRGDKLLEKLNLTRPDYDLILGSHSEGHYQQLILFNHGIYVGQFVIEGLDYQSVIYVNLKSDLVDLQISREDVKMNSKWKSFLYQISKDIFLSLESTIGIDKNVEIVAMYSKLLFSGVAFDKHLHNNLLEDIPFIKCFIENARFPLITNGSVSYTTGNIAFNCSECKIYNSNSRTIIDELDLLIKLVYDANFVINPYQWPKVRVDGISVRLENCSNGFAL